MKAFVLSLVLLAAPLRADSIEVRATLDDLEGLAAKEAWSELMMRLQDVVSSQRDARWEKIVERGALGYLGTLSSDGFTGADSVALEMTRTYPSLRHSKDFMGQRNALAIAAFENCLSGVDDDGDCAKRLLTFAEDDRDNVDFVVRAARTVAQKHGPGAALPFYAAALSPATRARVCGNKDVHGTLLAAMGEAKSASAAIALVDKHCWAWVKGDLLKEVDRQPAAAFAEGTCALLSRKNALGGREAKCGGKKKAKK